MPNIVNVTGGKYTGSITSTTNAYRVVNSAASFTAPDFTVQRIVALFSSTGVYKGVAWVASRENATTIVINTPFFNDEGTTVNQVIGDKYLVSKNFNDIAGSDIVINGTRVTTTAALDFGTSGVQDSVCFYDENKQIQALGFRYPLAPIGLLGGVVVFGRLNAFSAETCSRPCSLTLIDGETSGTYFLIGILVKSTAARFWWMGGGINAELSPYGNLWFLGALGGTPAANFCIWRATVNVTLITDQAGKNWSTNANKHKLSKCTFITDETNAISTRWADGVISGCEYIVGNAALAAFAADPGAGTYIVGSALEYTTILRCGDSAPTTAGIWRNSGSVGQNVTYINVVSPKRTIYQPASSDQLIFTYANQFTLDQDGTIAIIKNNNLDSSVASSGIVSASKVLLTVEEARVNGANTETVVENSWIAGFYRYGFNPAIRTFATTFATVYGGLQAKTVAFGGFVGQTVDTNISNVSTTSVAAYTVLDTLDKIYDYAQYWNSLNAINAIYPSVTQRLFVNTNGVLSAPTQNIIIDSSIASVAAGFGTTGTTIIDCSPTHPRLINGSKNKSLEISAGKTLTIMQPGDYSGLTIATSSTSEVFLRNGTTTLTGSTFASGTTFRRSGSGFATVFVDYNQIANIVNPSPLQVSIRSKLVNFTGFPTVNNANGLAPNARLAIKNPVSNAWSVYDVSSGSIAMSLSQIVGNTGATSLIVRADAEGYYRVSDIAINPATAADIDFSGLFRQIVDENNVAIAGKGIATEQAKISWNNTDYRFEFGAGAISFNSMVDEFEKQTSGNAGITIFEGSILTDIKFTKNAYSSSIQIPAPLMLAAAVDASSSPVFTDFIVTRTGNITSDVFTHGLSSTAAGLSTRPEIRQGVTKFISNSGTPYIDV